MTRGPESSAPARIVPAVPAATVMILRDAGHDPQVLLVERPDRGTFPGAWVFPGGKVEPTDVGADDLARARAAGVRETREETGLVLDPSALRPLALWEPPEHLPARYTTWFFAASDPGGELVLQPEEAVDAAWVRPADALGEHAAGTRTLVPPTFAMLHRLQLLGSRVFGDPDRAPEHLVTRLAARGVLVWQGDDAWDPEHPGVTGARHRLDIRQLPWRFERADGHD